MDFKKCLDIVLKFEGGWVKDPLDRGGETNFGITQRSYDTYRVGRNLKAQSVKFITSPEVSDCYFRGYWFPSGASSCEGTGFSLALFDYAVNSGVYRALRDAQRVLGLVDDGVLGPKTVERLKAVTVADAMKLLDVREAFLQGIVARKPDQKKFLKGWLNRTTQIRSIITTESKSNA